MPPAQDVKVLQNLGRMKEFDPNKWVDDSYIRKAYAELQPRLRRAAHEHRRITRSRARTSSARSRSPTRARQAKSGSTASDIEPFSSAACTLGAYADLKAKGKKINVAYVFDTARGIKLFADQAFFAVGRRQDRRSRRSC